GPAAGGRDALLPLVRVHRRPGRDLPARLELPEDLARLDVEGAQVAVAAADEADAAGRRRRSAALGLGRVELPDALAGRDVDRAHRAVVAPAAREHAAEVAVRDPEVRVAEQELLLLLLCGRLLLHPDRGLGSGVVHVARVRVERRRRGVESAERGRIHGDGLY